jgi:hypothetical protein
MHPVSLFLIRKMVITLQHVYIVSMYMPFALHEGMPMYMVESRRVSLSFLPTHARLT